MKNKKNKRYINNLYKSMNGGVGKHIYNNPINFIDIEPLEKNTNMLDLTVNRFNIIPNEYVKMIIYYQSNISPIINVLFYHGNCADGTSCCSIWLHINKEYTIVIPIQPSSNICDYFNIKNIQKLKKYSQNNQINFIFLDVVPPDIKQFIDLLKNFTNKHVTIIDHHKGNQNLIDSIDSHESYITINFKPDSKFGAVKQVIDLYHDKLSSEQINFFIPIAAMDMWNKEVFNKFNYLSFGLNNYFYENGIKMFEPEELLYLSNDGEIGINYFTTRGEEWIKTTKNYIKSMQSTFILFRMNEYVMYIINTSLFDEKYQKQNLTGVISFMFGEQLLKNSDINTLVFINNESDGLSFRKINQSNVDMNSLAKLCGGGGHVNAAGAKKNLFFNYCINQYINPILLDIKRLLPPIFDSTFDNKIGKFNKI